MRLWHIDLVKYLPRQQLLGQWRELGSIYKDEPNHMLINFVYEDKPSLYWYSLSVLKELKRREYSVHTDKFENYFGISKFEWFVDYLTLGSRIVDIFPKKMNDVYLRQCYYNLEEKYMCGGISENEWQQIRNHTLPQISSMRSK